MSFLMCHTSADLLIVTELRRVQKPIVTVNFFVGELSASLFPGRFSTQQTCRHPWPFGAGAELCKRFSQHLPLTRPRVVFRWRRGLGFGPGCRGAFLLRMAFDRPAALRSNHGERGFCKHLPGFGNFLSRFGQQGADTQLMLVQREHSCVQDIEHLNEGQSRRFPLTI